MLLKALRAFGDHVRSIPGSAPGRRARRRWLASGRVARAAGPPDELFTAGYWADLIQEAERGLLDFVTIEDGLGLQSARHFEQDWRTDQVRGRLDAVLIAARVAPLTSHIGLIPTAVVTHTEPFHISKAIATLDYVSTGRAGVRVQVSAQPARGGALRAPHVPGARPHRPVQPARSRTWWRSCSMRPPTT